VLRQARKWFEGGEGKGWGCWGEEGRRRAKRGRREEKRGKGDGGRRRGGGSKEETGKICGQERQGKRQWEGCLSTASKRSGECGIDDKDKGGK
jgi:hypothetical protein